MSSGERLTRALLLSALATSGAFHFSGAAPESAAYQPLPRFAGDSLKNHPAATSSVAGKAVRVPGYWSSWGLPPVQGEFRVSSAGVGFVPSDVGSPSAEPEWRPAMVSLAYVERDGTHVRYLFRIDANIFETDRPAALLALVADRARLLRPGAEPERSKLVDPADSIAIRAKAQEIGRSSYADSLYSLFGRPTAGIGLVGEKGRRAGRLGEYIAAKDSLALDPGRMTGESQLRHAFAHELAHRFQARANVQLTVLWTGVPSIRDSRRYGYNDVSEHQAEAIAFAVSFLQTTAPAGRSVTDALSLLEHYELLVPGTRIMVRYLLLQPIYAKHPLQPVLTTTRSL